jgi:sugar/nucleoside kinase (ribokinase family)
VEDGQEGGAPPKRIGVLGTLVWDTIHQRDGRSVPSEEWGGVAYALSAMSAVLPEGWEIVPILKVGKDLSEGALRYLRSLPGVELETGVRVVPEANNRVELRYHDAERRTERLSGGVPPWSWPELAPLVRTCDALYVNFISGFEMELDAARALRASYEGPTYADLHSLFLGIEGQGIRVPRELPSWGAWLRCFDAVQMNETEFELLGRAWGDPWQLAADLVGPELKLIAVTLGGRGAAYVRAPGFDPDPASWPRRRHGLGTAGAVESARVPLQGDFVEGDTTGCGDVWGATFFTSLLSGVDLAGAMAGANAAARRNVAHRGAAGLHHHLQGRVGDAGLP